MPTSFMKIVETQECLLTALANSIATRKEDHQTKCVPFEHHWGFHIKFD